MKAYGHGELNTEKFTNVNYIREKIESQKDFISDTPLTKVELDETFPEYIINNKKKFEEFLI